MCKRSRGYAASVVLAGDDAFIPRSGWLLVVATSAIATGTSLPNSLPRHRFRMSRLGGPGQTFQTPLRAKLVWISALATLHLPNRLTVAFEDEVDLIEPVSDSAFELVEQLRVG